MAARNLLRGADPVDTIADFRRYLAQASPRAELVVKPQSELGAAFVGCSSDGHRLAIFDASGQPPDMAPPNDFRVVAIVPTYNEEDIITQTICDLLRQRIDVFLIDNWSSDATVDCARQFLGRGLRAITRYPPDGPTASYDLRALMTEVERVSATLDDASWIVLHDADERRRSPWRGVDLRAALWGVDSHGFNCVDHVTMNFWPTSARGFDRCGPDLEQQLRHFEFSSHPGHFHQRRAWKQLHQPVALADSAGHDVHFQDRRVYPYRFLLKHYPIRSQAHGERKILRERVARWNQTERALGWHRQYDALCHTGQFVRRAEDLIQFAAGTFYERFLLERLSGVGIFEHPPDWATSPAW